ncbi:MAG: glutamate-1-semialdehyde 2,1-aminomutase [Lachnospiraceae bacterium]|jgi:glutamate-1-semialdehyde 2,1-aminomutase|nr:glutamate-1-semialdehyde 2,1-aminomutase [Lachnospiraceae bacterium]
MTKSEQLFQQAVKLMPGGVNSPVRAFGAVGGNPRFIERAKGPYVWDVDGNRYIDYIGSWGPMILGHSHPAVYEAVVKAAEKGLSFGAATGIENKVAELIKEMVPSMEMMRMVNSGTEAVMSAVRLARGYTGRSKIIKFAGCYHGHSDSMLVKAGSGAMTTGVPDSLGVPAGCAADTLTAVYNDASSVEALFAEHPGQIGAVILEPVAGNMGVVAPKEGFLQAMRDLCTREGALLIFDEVITGFRLSQAGAQGYFGVTPDLTTFGKIIGGGMPVGCYGGRKELMEMVAPSGGVYQAGTLSGNPVAMSAGLAELTILHEQPEIYDYINSLGDYYRAGARKLFEKYRKPWYVTGVGSLSCVFFTDGPVYNYEDARKADVEEFGRYFNYMINNGVSMAPSQFESIFISNAHTRELIDMTMYILEGYLSGE